MIKKDKYVVTDEQLKMVDRSFERAGEKVFAITEHVLTNGIDSFIYSLTKLEDEDSTVSDI
jgi:hypothetical protein